MEGDYDSHATARGKLDGIRLQVQHNLHETLTVRVHPKLVGVAIKAAEHALELDTLSSRLVSLQRHDIIDSVTNAEARDVFAELAGLNLRVVQQILQQEHKHLDRKFLRLDAVLEIEQGALSFDLSLFDVTRDVVRNGLDSIVNLFVALCLQEIDGAD